MLTQGGACGGPVAWVGQGPRQIVIMFHDEISCRVTDRLPMYLNSPQTSEISSWCSNDFLGKTPSFYCNYLCAHSPILVELLITHFRNIFGLKKLVSPIFEAITLSYNRSTSILSNICVWGVAGVECMMEMMESVTWLLTDYYLTYWSHQPIRGHIWGC